MEFSPELKMRLYSPDPPDPDRSLRDDEWRPFDYHLRRCLTGGLRGAWLGARSGFIATALVWTIRLLLAPSSGWGADLANISLIGGLLGLMTGAALGLALADEE
jgi:hypothetical protein